MELSQVNITPISPEDKDNLDFTKTADSSVRNVAFLKNSATLSELYNISVRVIFNTASGVKSLEGIVSNSNEEGITLQNIYIPFMSVSDIQF